MTQRRRPRRPKIVLVRFFLSLRFLASMFDHFLSDLGLILGGFGVPKSIIFGIEISRIFACRSKSGPRAAMGGPRAAKGGTRAARRGPRATKSGPIAAQERPRPAQERPRVGQERPKTGQEGPKSGPERPKSGQERPKAAQSGPRVAKSGSCCRARCRTKDVTSRRHRPLGLYNIMILHDFIIS